MSGHPGPAVAAALSEHPEPAEAIGEVIGEVLERVGPAPDLAALFVSPGLAGALEDLAGAVRAVLQPGHLIGAAAAGVIGGAHHADHGGPAVSLWAARTGPVIPVRLRGEPVDGGVRVAGLPVAAGEGSRTLVLIADPFSLPLDGLLEGIGEQVAHLTVVGGLASAGQGPGGNRLVLDGEVHREGAVGVLLPIEAPATTVVSQGCRPIGAPMIVTASDGNVIEELAGRSALDQLQLVAEDAGPEERALLAQGLQIGLVVDESRPTFGAGDFLVRNVLGADRAHGALAVGADVPVGTTVQFQVRDAASAEADLIRALGAAGPADGALVFTCTGRGRHLFGDPDGDATTVAEAVGPAVAGMACAGELGPVGPRTHLHIMTATVLLVRG